ncbi:MAG TPA: Mrp/NBP35 family ATP-binding protein [Acidimicrobiales bacterium]|nr:Mrp/NBP35 family ATP-binding protein [Acidimicrobiales bacterium]
MQIGEIPVALTQEQITEALRPVQDPELRRSIVELGMVKDIAVAGGAVTVTVALTVAGCPLRAELTNRVTEAVIGAGASDATVEFTVMTEEERARVSAIMGGAGHGHAGAGHQHGDGPSHAPAKPMPFREGSRTRVIGVNSGKGGVGKSSVTVNLAIALKQLGYDVAVLDADVYGFSIPAMLGVDQPPTVIDQMIVPPEAQGIRCISMGFFIDEDQAVIWRGPMLHKALEQFLTDVYWDEPDFLVVDMPPGTGDVSLSMAQYLPRTEIYVVTTPQPAAQRVAQRTAAMAKKLNLPVRGVIENMSWFTGDDGTRYELFGSGGGQSLAEDVDAPLLGQIPLVPELREGGDLGYPITVADPDGEASQAFRALAKRVADLGAARVYRSELKLG